MLELIFLAATAVAIFVLLRRTPLRAPTLRTWTTLGGVVLIAAPGIISLLSLTAPLLGTNTFSGDRTVLVPAASGPAATPGGLLDAPAVLVRGFLVVEGNDGEPVGRYEAVIRPGQWQQFALADGSRLDVAMGSRVRHPRTKGGSPAPHAALTFQWRAPRRSRGGTAWITPVEASEVGTTLGTHEVRVENLALDMAWFGSLLDDRHRPSRVHLFLTPLTDAGAVTAVAAPAWWEQHRADVTDRIRAGMRARQPIEEGYSSSFSVGEVLSVSGLLVLVAGSLLILLQSVHWVRTLCLLFLYGALYLGATDALLLRIHVAALSVGTPSTRTAAAAEAAATRLHPFTAARALLETGMAGEGRRVRLAAVRCLGRERFRALLPRVADSRRKLESLANGPDAEIAAAAAVLLDTAEER